MGILYFNPRGCESLDSDRNLLPHTEGISIHEAVKASTYRLNEEGMWEDDFNPRGCESLDSFFGFFQLRLQISIHEAVKAST
ncbi:hypothetical protein [Eisenbergiella sp.]|uniref:hypothetical protein n=1 Tax=Eisenbergiella sp. TaxID=1924109 RepID=UPI003FA406D1